MGEKTFRFGQRELVFVLSQLGRDHLLWCCNNTPGMQLKIETRGTVSWYASCQMRLHGRSANINGLGIETAQGALDELYGAVEATFARMDELLGVEWGEATPAPDA